MPEPIRTSRSVTQPPATPPKVRRGTAALSKAAVTQAIRKGTARLVAASDRLTLSTWGKLQDGNKRALSEAADTLTQTITHPIQTLKAMGRGIGDMLLHPERSFASVVDRFRKDPVDGAVAGANLGASYAGLGALALTIGAFVAAPFTAGASLGLLPVAGTLGSAAGAVGLGALGVSFFKNQADIAGAKTLQGLEKEASELGADYANAGFEVASFVAVKGIQNGVEAIAPKNVNPASAQRMSERLVDRVREKLAHQSATSQGGIDTTGMTPDQVRAEGIRQVAEAMDWSDQGPRDLSIQDVNRGSFEGLENVGERRLAFHGTRDDVRDLIVQNGFHKSDIGDFGEGIYLSSSPKAGVSYADDVTIGRGLTRDTRPVVFTAEVATGKAFDYQQGKTDFLEWATERFHPSDMSDPVNQLYAKPSVPISPLVDNTYTRYLPRYVQEMGFDSILVRGAEGLDKDFWIVQDSRRVLIHQAVTLDVPANRDLIPLSLDGKVLGTWYQTRDEGEREALQP